MTCLSTCHILLPLTRLNLIRRITCWYAEHYHTISLSGKGISYSTFLPSAMLMLNIDLAISRGFPVLCHLTHQKTLLISNVFSRRILTGFMAPSFSHHPPKANSTTCSTNSAVMYKTLPHASISGVIFLSTHSSSDVSLSILSAYD